MTENSRLQFGKNSTRCKKTDRQFSKLQNQINKQNEYFTKDFKTLKKNQIEILEMKDSVKEIKNELASTGNRADQMQERISCIQDRNLEMTQREGET